MIYIYIHTHTTEVDVCIDSCTYMQMFFVGTYIYIYIKHTLCMFISRYAFFVCIHITANIFLMYRRYIVEESLTCLYTHIHIRAIYLSCMEICLWLYACNRFYVCMCWAWFLFKFFYLNFCNKAQSKMILTFSDILSL